MLKRSLAVVLSLLFMVSLFGCSLTEEKDPIIIYEYVDPEPEIKVEVRKEPLYPLTVYDCEVTLGETPLKVFTDNWINVTIEQEDANGNKVDRDIVPDFELAPNTYYKGFSIWLDTLYKADICLATSENGGTMASAPIVKIDFDLKDVTVFVLRKLSFNGVPLSEMTMEKAIETFPDFVAEGNTIRSTGAEYVYSMTFSDETGAIIALSAEKEFNVNWDGLNK